jgi:hypothetical protein
LVSTARNVRTNANNARAERFAEIVTTNDWLLRFTDAPPSGGSGLTNGWVMPSVLIEIFACIAYHSLSHQAKLMLQIAIQHIVGRTVSIGRQAHRGIGIQHGTKRFIKSLYKIMP